MNRYYRRYYLKRAQRDGLKQTRVNIARGVALLDAERPGWRAEIDTDQLFLESDRDCVLGQLYGNYETGVARLGIEYGTDYGFESVAFVPYSKLNEEWKVVLSA